MCIVNGTTYHDKTSEKVISCLERCRLNGWRILIHYGDVSTGKDWHETCDVRGTISRSTGESKIPILVATSRSLGGGAILDHCIVRIEHSTKAARERYGDIYRADNYQA